MGGGLRVRGYLNFGHLEARLSSGKTQASRAAHTGKRIGASMPSSFPRTLVKIIFALSNKSIGNSKATEGVFYHQPL
jgi:hypothetical protein